MEKSTEFPDLTPALEDYLETIFRLVGESGFARVGDIARARDVRPGSVTPAMKRLDELGLITYSQREQIGLTARGESTARRIYAKHQILTRFFRNILKLPPDIAERDGCAVEHALSPETVDQLVRLFEYMEVCPEGKEYLERFSTCPAVHPSQPACPFECSHLPVEQKEGRPLMSIATLKPGQRGRVRQVNCQGAVRQRLLDMGILPGVHLKLARIAPAGDPVWIQLQGYELALRKSEASQVSVEAES